GEKETLLGNAQSLVQRHAGRVVDGKKAFPLAEVWTHWWDDRAKNIRDPDGFDSVRAQVLTGIADWTRGRLDASGLSGQAFGKSGHKLRYPSQVNDVIAFLAQRQRPEGTTDFLLDAAETGLVSIPAKFAVRWIRTHGHGYRIWLSTAERDFATNRECWTDDHLSRLIRLLLWVDRPVD
ncbi:unnamed protein product, partial [Ectocarpus fasciculatus]